MRISMLTLGSRGDVQPFVALGVALQAAGHRVKLATHENFRQFVTGWGLEFSPLAGDSQKLVESEEVQRIFELGQGWRWVQAGANWLAAQHEVLTADCWAACEGAEAVCYTPITYPAWHCAQALRIPSAAICFWPTSPTQEFSYPLFGLPDLGGALNYLSYKVFEQLVWWPLASKTNSWRQSLGLQALPPWGAYWLEEYRSTPWLYPFSTAMVPRPHDWPANHHVTGYWFLDAAQGWEPPKALVDFLEAGDPPVAIGFGSIVPRTSEALSAKVLEALQLAKCRAILLSGWGGLRSGELPSNCYQIDAVPHDWLFPRVSAVVCHSGAGTVGAALRAGKPVVGIPVFGDQASWAARAYQLGAGTSPIPYKDLSARGLAAAIEQAVSDSTINSVASRLGQVIRSEDGAGKAVRLLESHFAGWAVGTSSVGRSVV